MAGLPTVIKSYKYPETENYVEFGSCTISAVLTILTFKNWSFEYSAFPIYMLVFNLIVMLLIKFKLGKIYVNKLTIRS